VTFSRRVLELPGRRETAQSGHEEIVREIVARRPGAARNATLRHLRAVEADIAEHLAGDGGQHNGRAP
jgi:GntR family transcriptional repressor for pyruvate dehydrogenase complex